LNNDPMLFVLNNLTLMMVEVTFIQWMPPKSV